MSLAHIDSNRCFASPPRRPVAAENEDSRAIHVVSNPWHAVSIVPNPRSCAQARALVRVRFLSKDAPPCRSRAVTRGSATVTTGTTKIGAASRGARRMSWRAVGPGTGRSVASWRGGAAPMSLAERRPTLTSDRRAIAAITRDHPRSR